MIDETLIKCKEITRETFDRYAAAYSVAKDIARLGESFYDLATYAGKEERFEVIDKMLEELADELSTLTNG